jgi:hypothetical protein
MSKPTVSAAGGAMPAEGHNTPSLLNIADDLDTTRMLIIAAQNLAAEIRDIDGSALHAVITAAEEKLNGARDMLATIRGQKPEGAYV